MKRRSLLAAVFLAACAKPVPQKRYTLTGGVLALNQSTRMATIKGDKIEGWMEAMTMEYPVKDGAEFAKLKVGERITATIFVSDAGYHIGEIKVTGHPPAPK
jgi:Cu/Ag efflux protein CusF